MNRRPLPRLPIFPFIRETPRADGGRLHSTRGIVQAPRAACQPRFRRNVEPLYRTNAATSQQVPKGRSIPARGGSRGCRSTAPHNRVPSGTTHFRRKRRAEGGEGGVCVVPGGTHRGPSAPLPAAPAAGWNGRPLTGPGRTDEGGPDRRGRAGPTGGGVRLTRPGRTAFAMPEHIGCTRNTARVSGRGFTSPARRTPASPARRAPGEYVPSPACASRGTDRVGAHSRSGPVHA